jgi:ribosome-associated translation inhibitor RaiA
MVESITFRHGTENKFLRQFVRSECQKLTQFLPSITSVNVVISRESKQRPSKNRMSCHISIHAANKQNVDIYEQQPSELQAFDCALERAIAKLSRYHEQKSYLAYAVGSPYEPGQACNSNQTQV